MSLYSISCFKYTTFLPAAQFQLPPKIQPKHATRHPTGKLYKLQPPRRFFLHLASYCVFDMINITFTCRITCKQVNKDLFFKIPVLRLSYFYKGKSSDIYDSIMILSYPYTIQLKNTFFRRLCAFRRKDGRLRAETPRRFGKTRRNFIAGSAAFPRHGLRVRRNAPRFPCTCARCGTDISRSPPCRPCG